MTSLSSLLNSDLAGTQFFFMNSFKFISQYSYQISNNLPVTETLRTLVILGWSRDLRWDNSRRTDVGIPSSLPPFAVSKNILLKDHCFPLTLSSTLNCLPFERLSDRSLVILCVGMRLFYTVWLLFMKSRLFWLFFENLNMKIWRRITNKRIKIKVRECFKVVNSNSKSRNALFYRFR